MKLSVCIDALFPGEDPREILPKVREAGGRAVEFWSWWDKDLDVLGEAVRKEGLEVSAFCTRLISLVDPSKRGEYRNGLADSIAVAKKLHCRSLITQVGNDTGYSRALQHRSLREGLAEAARMLEPEGITLLVEPLNNHQDHPGYYLSSSLEGFELIEEVGSPNVRLLFDIYHQQITEGNLLTNIRRHISLIGHFHAAGVPGRHEPDTGELDYGRIARAIDETGFEGYMGLECFPLGDPVSCIRSFSAEIQGSF